jgi:phosphatidylserine/phosphatidylglycerophosphate/cardiolipin synthase-like enzyme
MSIVVRSYASPGCVLLAFDWPEGENHPDFLGFAIQRNPGYSAGGAPQFLLNKLDFVPLAKDAKPKPSNQAPIQKFNWWDGGIKTGDRGKTFKYTVTPVRGTGPGDLALQDGDAKTLAVRIPNVREGQIATYFNRAVVSSQSFLRLKSSDLKAQMTWLANGLQEAVPTILKDSDSFDCAIYHLSDKLWILPAFDAFSGRGSISYFDKPIDRKSATAIAQLNKTKDNISTHKRDAISKLMHDKFIVSNKAGSAAAVLMGSTNFTPEAQTIQANLLHILHSPQLADLYRQRADLLAANTPTKVINKHVGWQEVTDVPGTKLRAYFLPEPASKREFLDTVTAAVKGAKSSVLFCMFTASDPALMDAIFAQGDSKDHLIYGLLNSVEDTDAAIAKGKKTPSAVAVEIFHRTKEKSDTIPFSAFFNAPPRGFLPELRGIDTSKYDISAKKAAGSKVKGPPPIHVHHKFIVVDGDTNESTIYSGSPNFSKASENSNDENVLEIKGNQTLSQVYVAEFMRLYNHYRARAIWNKTHEKKPAGGAANGGDPLVLKKSRDAWVADAYVAGSKGFLARRKGL